MSPAGETPPGEAGSDDPLVSAPSDAAAVKPFEGSPAKPFEAAAGEPFGAPEAKPFEGAAGEPFDGSPAKPFEGAAGEPFEGSPAKPFEAAAGEPFEGSPAKPFDAGASASFRPAGAVPLAAVEPASAFRVVGEQAEWHGRRISVAVAEIEGPDGARYEREVVHHPGAVGVVPLHDDRTVTLVCQYRAALDRMIWEVPAGLRDVDGEPTVQTAARELAEEAGLAASSFEHLLTFHNSPGFSDEALEIYVATGLSEVADDRQGPEEQHMLVERVPLAEALAMVDDGRITDAKTVIALLATARRLEGSVGSRRGA